MSSRIVSDTEVGRYTLRGRVFRIRRQEWNDHDGLSFDVDDVATGEILTAESFDAEPGPDEIRELLESLEAQREAGTLDSFFAGNAQVLEVLDAIADRHTVRIHISNRFIVSISLNADEALGVEVDGREYVGVRVPDGEGEGVAVIVFPRNDDNITYHPAGSDLSYSLRATVVDLDKKE